MWDSPIQGFRLKKRTVGSRYTQNSYHKSESKLTKLIEQFYGPSNVFTVYHPKWAISDKEALLEFDIFIKPNILVEYNGVQHYRFTKFFQKNRSVFKSQNKRDKLKYRLAKKNGFKVVIFKYDEPMFKD